MQIGDKVKFNDAVSGRMADAVVVDIRDDGTLDLKYQHPYQPGAWVECSKAREGMKIWCWHVPTADGVARADGMSGQQQVTADDKTESFEGGRIKRKTTLGRAAA